MGFSKTTKILGLHGYVDAVNLRVGDTVRTPIGKTKITEITVTSPQKIVKVSEGFSVVRWKRVLKKDRSWGLIKHPSMDIMFELGVLSSEKNVPCLESDLFSFFQRDVQFKLSDKKEENVVISTENGILVADSFVCSATSQTTLFAGLPSISDDETSRFFEIHKRFFIKGI